MVLRKDKQVSKAAQKLIDDKALDGSKITGTGKGGSITATDVNNYILALKDTPKDNDSNPQVAKEIVEDTGSGFGSLGGAKVGGQSLTLHCGANLCEVGELDLYPVPDTVGKRSVHIPHSEIVNSAIHALTDEGYKITEHAHSITKEGARYFGMIAISKPSIVAPAGDFDTVIGLRNSYDGSSGLAFVMGGRVFVCDNLAFHGELNFSMRHDHNILNLDLMVVAAAKKLQVVHADMVKRVDAYKERALEHKEADHLMIECLRQGVYNPSRIERVRQEWDNPSHDEFADSNVWRMHNAITEALKPTNESEQGALPRIALQTNRLHNVFDGYCERLAA